MRLTTREHREATTQVQVSYEHFRMYKQSSPEKIRLRGFVADKLHFLCLFNWSRLQNVSRLLTNQGQAEELK